MKKTKWLVVMGIALLFAGCIPSVNPLYTEKDLVFNPGLLGVWGEVDAAKTNTWTFRQRDEKSYALTIQEEGKSAQFVAHLVKLGKYQFLDLFPDGDGLSDLNQPDIYKWTLIPGHLFLKVWQIEPTLQMNFMNPDWLDKLLKKDPKAIAHRGSDDKEGIVLTASTRQLQKFFVKYAESKEAFKEPDEALKRIGPPPKADAR